MLRNRKDGKIEMLRSIPLFSSCSDKELQRISAMGDQVELAAGSVLTREGSPGRECFVLAAGRATVTLRDEKLAELVPGDVAGEMALIDREPRSATVVAETPVTLFVLDPRAFWQLLDEYPTVARRVIRAIVERLRRTESAPTW